MNYFSVVDLRLCIFGGEKVEAVYFGGFLCDMKSSYAPTGFGVHSVCLIFLMKAL